MTFWKDFFIPMVVVIHLLYLFAFFCYDFIWDYLAGKRRLAQKHNRYLNLLWRPYFNHIDAFRDLRFKFRHKHIRGYVIEWFVLHVLAIIPFVNLFNSIFVRIFLFAILFAVLIIYIIYLFIYGIMYSIVRTRKIRVEKALKASWECFKEALRTVESFETTTDSDRYRDSNRYQVDIRIILLLIVSIFLLFLLSKYPHKDWLNSIAIVFAAWRLPCLVLYTTATIFFQHYGVYRQPASIVRSLILLLFGYLEIILGFSLLYLSTGCLRRPIDSFHFSVMTITTLGYGDFRPREPLGPILASLEVLMGVLYVVLIFADYIQRASGKSRT